MAQYELSALPLHRCVVFTGDLSRPALGLSDDDYKLLAHTVDAIWHNGAHVDHVLDYGRLRAANVFGTLEVLRLAARSRVKPVHFVSTNATCFSASGNGRVTESLQLPRASQLVDGKSLLVNGYVQSKWVAERLMMHSSRRGLPVTIHKPGRVLSCSMSGACNADDLLTRFLVGCVQLGSVPLIRSAPQEYGAPVDKVAGAIVALGLDAHARSGFGQTFLVHQGQPVAYMAHLFAIGRDYGLRLAEHELWLGEMRDGAGNVALPLIHELQGSTTNASPTSAPTFDNRLTVAALANLSRSFGPALDYDHARLQLGFLRRRRILPPPIQAAGVDTAADWVAQSLREAVGLSDCSPSPSLVSTSGPDELPALCMACDDSTCDFQPLELSRRPVGEHDVHIKVLFCGVCHSDLSVAAGRTPTSTLYPLVPGHEAVGVCVRVGARVTKFKLGDHVGVGPLVDSCRGCHSCLDGDEHRCSKQVPTYNGRDWSGRAAMGGGVMHTAGGYSTAMVVNEHFCICIPAGYPLEHAGPVLCAGTTMYDPLRRAGVKPGTRLGIVGLGGLGVMGVKLGKALGCEVTVLSRCESKRGLALRAGADRFIALDNPIVEPLNGVEWMVPTGADQLAALSGSLDLLINTIPTKHDSSVFASLLTPHGKQIHTGAHAVAFAAGAIEMLMPRQARERMTYIGGVACTQEVMDLCARMDIRTEIDVRPVSQLNRIFEWLDGANESGKRYVLDIAGSLNDEVSTAPATRLKAAVPFETVSREIAEIVVEQLVRHEGGDAQLTDPHSSPSSRPALEPKRRPERSPAQAILSVVSRLWHQEDDNSRPWGG